QAEDGIRDFHVTGVQTCALPIYIGFENLPPLQHAFGTVTVRGNVDVLLSSRIRNIETGAPMLAFSESQGRRSAYLLGENIWKWRSEERRVGKECRARRLLYL